MKYILKKIVPFIFFPIIFIFRILQKKYSIRLGLLDFSRIGHAVSYSANYLIEKKINTKKYFDVIFSSNETANHFLKKKISKKISFFNSQFFYNTFNYCYKYWFNDQNYLIKFNINSLGKISVIENFIYFSEKEKNYIDKSLLELGITKKDKWICIHNRDAAYLNSIYPDKDWSYHNYRNFPINDLLKVCKKMINKGYTVIRVGSIVEESLNFSHPKFIDYHLLKNKSELLESYLLTNAYLYFGSDSGIFNLSMVSKIPFSFINFPSVTNMVKYYFWSPVPFIFKLRRNENNEIISLSKQLENKLDNTFRLDEFENKKIQLINNTPDEILDLFVEINLKDELKEELIEDTENKYLEKKFWEIFDSCAKLNNLPEKKPYIGKKFLKNHSYILQ